MKRDIQHKQTTGLMEAGAAPAIKIKGVCAEIKNLRSKHRCPFRFCGALPRKMP